MAEAKDAEGDCSLRGTEGMRHFLSTLGEKTKPGMHIWPRLLAKSLKKLHPYLSEMENSVKWIPGTRYFSAFLIFSSDICTYEI